MRDPQTFTDATDLRIRSMAGRVLTITFGICEPVRVDHLLRFSIFSSTTVPAARPPDVAAQEDWRRRSRCLHAADAILAPLCSSCAGVAGEQATRGGVESCCYCLRRGRLWRSWLPPMPCLCAWKCFVREWAIITFMYVPSVNHAPVSVCISCVAYESWSCDV